MIGLDAGPADGPAPLELYAQAVETGARLRVVAHGADARPVALSRWLSRPSAAERALLAALPHPVLDVGCGPGRHVRWLQSRDVPALGVELSAAVARLARARGARVLHGSIFGPIPACGSWGAALLLDGNVGIGGDPERLLRRVGELLRPGGVVVAEIDQPGHGPGRVELRLEHRGLLSASFPWACLGSADLAIHAQRAGLAVTRVWRAERRWFASLRRRAAIPAAALT